MDKLKKLLRLARDPNAHDGERRNARERASALALKLGVNIEDVEHVLDCDVDPRTVNSQTFVLRNQTANIFVELVGQNVMDRFEDVVINWSRFPGGHRNVTISRLKPNRPDEAIKLMKDQLRHMDKGWAALRDTWKAMKKPDRRSFMIGCAKGMHERIQEQMWRERLPDMMKDGPDSIVERMKARHESKGELAPTETPKLEAPADSVPTPQESLPGERKTQPKNRGLLLPAPPEESKKEEKPPKAPPPLQRESWTAGYKFGRTMTL